MLIDWFLTHKTVLLLLRNFDSIMNYYFPVQIKKTLSIFFCTFISFHFVFHRRFITSYICKNVGFNALFKCKVVSLLTNLSDFAIWLMTLLEGKFKWHNIGKIVVKVIGFIGMHECNFACTGHYTLIVKHISRLILRAGLSSRKDTISCITTTHATVTFGTKSYNLFLFIDVVNLFTVIFILFLLSSYKLWPHIIKLAWDKGLLWKIINSLICFVGVHGCRFSLYRKVLFQIFTVPILIDFRFASALSWRRAVVRHYIHNLN